jgi:hypothetical protein
MRLLPTPASRGPDKSWHILADTLYQPTTSDATQPHDIIGMDQS